MIQSKAPEQLLSRPCEIILPTVVSKAKNELSIKSTWMLRFHDNQANPSAEEDGVIQSKAPIK